MKPNGKTFKQNLKLKLPVFGVVSIILWFGAGGGGIPHLVADRVRIFRFRGIAPVPFAWTCRR